MSSLRLRLGICFAATGLVATAAPACSDSLHLDPNPPAQGGSGPGPGAGGSGGGPIACSSSSDCPAPTSVCDVVKSLCVECLEFADCAFRPGTVCSQGECVCEAEGESWCPAITADVGARPARCAALATSSEDCGSCGHACFGACAAGKCADPWEPTPLAGAPAARVRHACAWTGSELLVWGGDGGGYPAQGGLLDPAAGTWRPMSVANAPSPRSYVAGTWTGERFFVWGGHDGNVVGTGGLYDPATNTWKPVSPGGAPSPRYGHSAVWAGNVGLVLVWGGVDSMGDLDTGARYDPETDTWTAMSTTNGPSRRRDHGAVWTGSRMLVYGGIGFDGTDESVFLAGGKMYDPASDTWEDLPTEGQPSPRARYAAVAAGAAVVVWGGERSGASGFVGDGATLLASAWVAHGGPAPSQRRFHTGVWIDEPVERVVFWGGDGPAGRLNDGAILEPPGTFSATPLATGPTARTLHCAVAAGTKMIIWGGDTAAGATQTGAILDVAATQ